MKKIVVFILLFICTLDVFSQVPYFAGGPAKKTVFLYSSFKFRPTVNDQVSYSSGMYGVTDAFSVGSDLFVASDSKDLGFALRYVFKICPYFNIAPQVLPSFDLNNSMKFKYATLGLFLDGKFKKEGNLFWCANTLVVINRNRKIKDIYEQYMYLGYPFKLKNGHSITAMLGTIYSWEFEKKPDLTIGTYYSMNNVSFYLWTNDLITKYPRIVLGIDFTFGV